jgi:hypothetical protein
MCLPFCFAISNMDRGKGAADASLPFIAACGLCCDWMIAGLFSRLALLEIDCVVAIVLSVWLVRYPQTSSGGTGYRTGYLTAQRIGNPTTNNHLDSRFDSDLSGATRAGEQFAGQLQAPEPLHFHSGV